MKVSLCEYQLYNPDFTLLVLPPCLSKRLADGTFLWFNC